MDQSNYRDILRLAQSPAEAKKVKKILDYTSDENGGDVPDPYWDDDGFEKVYQMLDQACDALIEAHR